MMRVDRNDLKAKLFKVAYLAVHAEMERKIDCYQLALDFAQLQRKAGLSQTEEQAENVLDFISQRDMIFRVGEEVKLEIENLMMEANRNRK